MLDIQGILLVAVTQFPPTCSGFIRTAPSRRSRPG